MFAKFNISIDEMNQFCNHFNWDNVTATDIDKEFASQKGKSKKLLDSNLLKDNIWDGDAIRELNFPTEIGKFDVFISHSHNDVDEVKRFAYLLKHKFNINCFIDSSIWGNMEDLLKTIDKDYSKSKSDPKYYDYNKRNFSTAHVHAMLSMALMEMIENCDCFLFIGSDQSMLNLPYFKDHSDATLSPWIFEENKFVHLIKPNIPDWALKKSTKYYSADGSLNESERLKIAYRLDLHNFHKLSYNILCNVLMKKKVDKNISSLDELCATSGIYDELNNLLYD